MVIQINKIFSRNLSFRKATNWYANLHKPRHDPPYSHVVQIGDPVLRQTAEPVPAELIKSDEINFLVQTLKTVLHRYNSVGLSAPQIGIPLRVFVMEFDKKRQKEFSNEIYNNRKMTIVPFTAFINPKLKVTDYNKIIFPEACESVRGFCADVPRYSGIEITGFNENGEEVKVEADGWTARIIQHEMEHLDGKLYTDTMDRKTLHCTCWQSVNERGGKIELPFLPS